MENIVYKVVRKFSNGRYKSTYIDGDYMLEYKMGEKTTGKKLGPFPPRVFVFNDLTYAEDFALAALYPDGLYPDDMSEKGVAILKCIGIDVVEEYRFSALCADFVCIAKENSTPITADIINSYLCGVPTGTVTVESVIPLEEIVFLGYDKNTSHEPESEDDYGNGV